MATRTNEQRKTQELLTSLHSSEEIIRQTQNKISAWLKSNPQPSAKRQELEKLMLESDRLLRNLLDQQYDLKRSVGM